MTAVSAGMHCPDVRKVTSRRAASAITSGVGGASINMSAATAKRRSIFASLGCKCLQASLVFPATVLDAMANASNRIIHIVCVCVCVCVELYFYF